MLHFHGGNRGSNPRGDANIIKGLLRVSGNPFFLVAAFPGASFPG